MGASGQEFKFDSDKLTESVSVNDPGEFMVAFYQQDGTTPLDPAIFTVKTDGSGSAESPLMTKQIDDFSKSGIYSVVYKVWLQNYPSISAIS